MTSIRPTSSVSDISATSPTAYDRSFWLAYLGMSMLMTGYGLLYRYADFVNFLGGSEFHIGWIVGVGTVGSLAMRLFLGVGIDRYGPRLIWAGSLLLISISCLSHLAISSHTGVGIYILRIIFACGMAGVFGSSITFVSNRVTTNRVAELVGMLGTAGYVGMMLGSQLGDFLCSDQVSTGVQQWQVYGMFVGAGLLSGLAIPFVWLATRGMPRPGRRREPSMFRLLQHYNPGIIVVVGIITGLALGLPDVFLRTFAMTLDLSRISLFFTTYAITTIATRVLIRGLSQRLPLKPMILWGLGFLSASMMSFVIVQSYWQLIIPGIGFGITQAVLAPSVIAATNLNFPSRFRGLGTTVVLASFDLGYLVGAPAAGAMVHFCGLAGLPAYPILFSTIVVLIVLVGIVYAVVPERKPLEEQVTELPELLAGGEFMAAAANCPAASESHVTPKSIDPLESCAYHPAVEYDETLSMDARGSTGKPKIE
ncbi:MAG: MFS transporter [Pirellulales bacterium]|nr:MFS transporter [Pirellulales bacterium]